MSSIENENVIQLVEIELEEFNAGMQALSEVQLSSQELDESWQNINARLSRGSAAKRTVVWYSAAACAAFLVVVFAMQFKPQTVDPMLMQVENAISNSQNDQPSLQALKQYNQLMQQRIQSLPAQPNLVRANTVDTITRLEDQIALLDYRLATLEQQPASSEEYRALWQQRARSMNGLYQVKAAQAQRTSQQPAFQRVAYYD